MFKITDEQIVRIMIYEIRDKHPEAVKFIVTPENVKTVLLYLVTKKYDTIMYLFGHEFLLKIMNMYEGYENYEVCDDIVKQIQLHNTMFDENIPTK